MTNLIKVDVFLTECYSINLIWVWKLFLFMHYKIFLKVSFSKCLKIRLVFSNFRYKI